MNSNKSDMGDPEPAASLILSEFNSNPRSRLAQRMNRIVTKEQHQEIRAPLQSSHKHNMTASTTTTSRRHSEQISGSGSSARKSSPFIRNDAASVLSIKKRPAKRGVATTAAAARTAIATKDATSLSPSSSRIKKISWSNNSHSNQSVKSSLSPSSSILSSSPSHSASPSPSMATSPSFSPRQMELRKFIREERLARQCEREMQVRALQSDETLPPPSQHTTTITPTATATMHTASTNIDIVVPPSNHEKENEDENEMHDMQDDASCLLYEGPPEMEEDEPIYSTIKKKMTSPTPAFPKLKQMKMKQRVLASHPMNTEQRPAVEIEKPCSTNAAASSMTSFSRSNHDEATSDTVQSSVRNHAHTATPTHSHNHKHKHNTSMQTRSDIFPFFFPIETEVKPPFQQEPVPIIPLGTYAESACLDFGDGDMNIVGQSRSLPFDLHVPHDCKRQTFSIRVEQVPLKKGFTLGLVCDGINSEAARSNDDADNLNNVVVDEVNDEYEDEGCSSHLLLPDCTSFTISRGETKRMFLTWTPIAPGGVCEVAYLKLERGRVQVTARGHAKSKAMKKSVRPSSKMGARSRSRGRTSSAVARKETFVPKVKSFAVGSSANFTTVNQENVQLPSMAQFEPNTIQRSWEQYNDDWAAQQCEAYAKWLNHIFLTPEIQECEQDSAITLRTILAARRLAQASQRAQSYFNGAEMQIMMEIIQSEVYSKRLEVRSDHDVFANVRLRSQMISLLMSYSTPWLRLGLETVFGESIFIETSTKTTHVRANVKDSCGVAKHQRKITTRSTMKKFIAERVLSDPHLKMKYTRGKCNVPSGRFERRYKNELNRYILTKILTLTVFLDGAKRNNVIPPSVLLFQRKAMVKSSQDSLNILCRDYIAGIGNLPKYLLNVGVSVTYQQDPSEEFEFNVSNLATDLRDGVRLGKLAEILGQSTGVLEQMRLPAISRLQKVFNVGVSLSALTTLGVPNVDRIHPNYIVDGHRPQVLKMLWSIMTSFQLSSLLCNERLKQEIYAIHRTNESRVGSIFFSSLCGNVDTCDNTCDLLLVWCQAVCSCYNYTVSNFSASFADGVALCLVLNFYHPSIVGLESILPTCASKTTEWKTSTSAKVNRFVENERRNCLLAIAKMKDIGGVPNMFPVSDSFNVPDERATIICVAYLCSRLLESSTEIRAIVIIQNAFRRSLKRSELHSNRLAVQIIEKVWLGKRHGYFRRQREKYIRAVKVIEYFFLSRRAILQQLTRERLFSTRIQKYIRGYIARCRARSLRQRINTACTIQKIWRGFSTQRRYLQIRSGVIQFQTVARTFLAKEDLLHMLDSIVRIQCFSRRWLANQRLVEKWVERDHHCRLVGFTILCQSLFRRKHEMRKYKRVRESNAAIIIQTSFRKYALLASFSKEKKAVVAIQSIIRMHIVINSYRSLKIASTFVQTRYRRAIAQKCLFRCEMNDLIRQKSPISCLALRGSSAQESNKTLELRGVLVIQSAYRRHAHFSKIKLQTKAAIKIQAAVRKTITIRRQFRLNSAATLIQARWRGFLALFQFCFDLSDIVFVQSLARQRIAEKVVAKRLHASKLIQTTAIGDLSVKQSMKMATNNESPSLHMAAILLQKYWRRYAANMDYRIFLSAVVTIQRFIRSSKRRIASPSHNHSCIHKQYALKIQRWWRNFVIIPSCEELSALAARRQMYKLRKPSEAHQAATQIQSVWRGYNVRVDYLLLLVATTNIQRNYRELCVTQRNSSSITSDKNDSIIDDYRVRKVVQDLDVKKTQSLVLKREEETIASFCEKESLVVFRKLDGTKEATEAPEKERKERKTNILSCERNTLSKLPRANPIESYLPINGTYCSEKLPIKCSSIHSTHKMYDTNRNGLSVDHNVYDQTDCFAANNTAANCKDCANGREEDNSVSALSKRGRNETQKRLDLSLPDRVGTEHESSSANGIHIRDPLVGCLEISNISAYIGFEGHRQSAIVTKRDSFGSGDTKNASSSCMKESHNLVVSAKSSKSSTHLNSLSKREVRSDREVAISLVQKNQMPSFMVDGNISEASNSEVNLITSTESFIDQNYDSSSNKKGLLLVSNGGNECDTVTKNKTKLIPLKNVSIKVRPSSTSRIEETSNGAPHHLKMCSGVTGICRESISEQGACHSPKNIQEKTNCVSMPCPERCPNDNIQNFDITVTKNVPLLIKKPAVVRAATMVDKGVKAVNIETFVEINLNTSGKVLGPLLCHANTEIKHGNAANSLCNNDLAENAHRGSVLGLKNDVVRKCSEVKKMECLQGMKLACESSVPSTTVGFLSVGSFPEHTHNPSESTALATETEATQLHGGEQRRASHSVSLKSKVLAQISSTSKAAPHFGPRTKDALKTLKTSTNLREVMIAVRTLENTTKLSASCCKAFAKSDSPKILYDLMRSCNRSVPHIELLEYILDTLFHVSKHSDLIETIADDRCIETLIDVIQLFRDKDEIFCAAAIILKRIVFNGKKYLMICQKTENVKRILGVYKLRKGEFVSRVEERRKSKNQDSLIAGDIGESNGIRTLKRILEKCITKK